MFDYFILSKTWLSILASRQLGLGFSQWCESGSQMRCFFQRSKNAEIRRDVPTQICTKLAALGSFLEWGTLFYIHNKLSMIICDAMLHRDRFYGYFLESTKHV